MTSRSDRQLVNILIKIITKKYKKEEFLESMHIYIAEMQRQPGCISYNLYQNLNEANSYVMVSEWESVKAMEKHFQTYMFELSLGAAKVLCNSFEIQTIKVLHTGDLNWARKQIRPSRNISEIQNQ